LETQPWDYVPWQHKTPSHKQMAHSQLFQSAPRARSFNPDFVPIAGDVVVTPHKTFDALHGTDLSTQLRQRDVDHLILCGLTTNTCVDSTGRDAVEQGFEVTFVADAVTTFTMEMHRATIEQNWPRYAHHVLSTDEVIAVLSPERQKRWLESLRRVLSHAVPERPVLRRDFDEADHDVGAFDADPGLQPGCHRGVERPLERHSPAGVEGDLDDYRVRAALDPQVGRVEL
jgi:hypothetical protein